MSKKQGRDLITDALSDAQSLKDAILETAKNELIETMSPALKQLLEKSIRGTLTGDKAKSLSEGEDKGDTKMGKKDDQELDLEAIAGMFPQLAETDGVEDDMMGMGKKQEDFGGFGGIPTLGEEDMDAELPEARKAKGDDEEAEEAAEDEPVDEEIEISESELRKVYELAMQTEAQVKKGFGDMTSMGELDDVAKDVGKGLNPAKSGEAGWEAVEPPAKQDFTVKEMIRRGVAENRALRESLSKAIRTIRTLGSRLHEVNLFNTKVMHVNRILNSKQRLTSEQKKVVVETIDRARTISEVKMVYEAIVGSFKATTALTEGKARARKPFADAQRARTSGTPNQKVLSESVDRGGEERKARFQTLAGISK